MKQYIIFLLFIWHSISSIAQCDIEAKIDFELNWQNTPNEKVTENDITEKRFPAPATISFYGNGSGDIIYYTWFIYKDKDFNNPIARYTDRNITYTFEQSGNYVIKFEVADNSSECIAEDSLSFQITESYLDPPNFFSPGDSPGSNDEFRVAYRSLVKFKCTILNRWGQKLYEFNDPAKGWDGRYKGKLVNTGVYFYVIEAEGSDGIRYKKGGDINLFRSR